MIWSGLAGPDEAPRGGLGAETAQAPAPTGARLGAGAGLATPAGVPVWEAVRLGPSRRPPTSCRLPGRAGEGRLWAAPGRRRPRRAAGTVQTHGGGPRGSASPGPRAAGRGRTGAQDQVLPASWGPAPARRPRAPPRQSSPASVSPGCDGSSTCPVGVLSVGLAGGSRGHLPVRRHRQRTPFPSRPPPPFLPLPCWFPLIFPHDSKRVFDGLRVSRLPWGQAAPTTATDRGHAPRPALSGSAVASGGRGNTTVQRRSPWGRGTQGRCCTTPEGPRPKLGAAPHPPPRKTPPRVRLSARAGGRRGRPGSTRGRRTPGPGTQRPRGSGTVPSNISGVSA